MDYIMQGLNGKESTVSCMNQFLELRCPSRQKKKALNCKGYNECRRELAGPSIETLELCLSSGPFVDMRYCSCCKTMWKITISNSGDIPQFERMMKDAEIPFVRDTDYFDLIAIDSTGNQKA